MFGLCHLGVVKALLQHGLLPRIIAGTATGAIIAALVGVHAEDELIEILEEKRIDITAFANRPYRNDSSILRYYDTFLRRLQRWRREGHFFDIGVLEELLKANIGDITFEEAYNKTKRVLNITVSSTGGNGVPNLLNYLTAPNVVSKMIILSGIPLTTKSLSGQRHLSPMQQQRRLHFSRKPSCSAKTRMMRSNLGLLLIRPRSAHGHMQPTPNGTRHSTALANYSTSIITSSHKPDRILFRSYVAILLILATKRGGGGKQCPSFGLLYKKYNIDCDRLTSWDGWVLLFVVSFWTKVYLGRA